MLSFWDFRAPGCCKDGESSTSKEALYVEPPRDTVDLTGDQSFTCSIDLTDMPDIIEYE